MRLQVQLLTCALEKFLLPGNMRLLTLSAALAAGLGKSAAAVVARNGSLVSCLQSSLSSEGSVYLPGDSGFANDTIRWNRYHMPTFNVVAAVANEHDVRASVRIKDYVRNGCPN